MAPDDGVAFQKAMDNLMTQVTPDNVVAVQQEFENQAMKLKATLNQLTVDTNVGLCGADPISIDAAEAFNGKIAKLLEVHWKHQAELEAVAAILKETVREYGRADSQAAHGFRTNRPE